MFHDLLFEAAAQEHGLNRCEDGESIEDLDLSVVHNLKISGDLGQDRERDVGELGVVGEGNGVLDLRQVGGGERLQLVVGLELDRVGGLESGDLQTLGTTDLNLTGLGEVAHGNLHVLTVVSDDELGGDVAEGRVVLSHLRVVIDGEAVDGRELKAAQAVQISVSDTDGAGLCDTIATENKGPKCRRLDN